MSYVILFVVWLLVCFFVEEVVPNIGASWHAAIGFTVGIVWLGAMLKWSNAF